MTPSLEQIKTWANFDDVDDGWVKIPYSAWDGLLFVLGKAEEIEQKLAAAVSNQESKP